MIDKWSLSYIQFIGWFFTCLDLYIVCHHLNYFTASMFLIVLQEVISPYVCEMIIIIYLNDCRLYVVGCFYENWCCCMFEKWLSLYIQFIDKFFTFLELLFFWIIVVRMLSAVLQKVITLYDCEMIVIAYTISLIDLLLA